ncbi:hypothetical protein [Aquimarina macrocephali]|uniref:hypothetical protein n=1 Tax=Aquimarina macrocephali TaxID=666563 RepID=UPI000465C91D|nr:hypothetical protein [Aquimarina macrocephali]
MRLHKSHIHGNSVALEYPRADQATGKRGAYYRSRYSSQDNVPLSGDTTVACLRLRWGSRFIFYDSGSKNKPKSGSVWCHYAIPTPVIEEGSRARIRRVEINYESTMISEISVGAVEVWDGNRLIHEETNPGRSGVGINGGITGSTRDFRNVPEEENVLIIDDIPDQFIFFGLSVSIKIEANNAKDDYLEIRSVGADFAIDV